MGDRETITRILSYVSDDRDLEERVIDAANWTTSTVEDSYETIPVGILRSRLKMEKLSWYGQINCLSNEDRQQRRHEPRNLTCQCDSLAEAWSNSIQMLHGFAFLSNFFDRSSFFGRLLGS